MIFKIKHLKSNQSAIDYKTINVLAHNYVCGAGKTIKNQLIFPNDLYII